MDLVVSGLVQDEYQILLDSRGTRLDYGGWTTGALQAEQAGMTDAPPGIPETGTPGVVLVTSQTAFPGRSAAATVRVAC
jgi:hypothetical protein